MWFTLDIDWPQRVDSISSVFSFPICGLHLFVKRKEMQTKTVTPTIIALVETSNGSRNDHIFDLSGSFLYASKLLPTSI